MDEIFITLSILPGSIGCGHCTTASRFDADIVACNWEPNLESNYRIYSKFESTFERTNLTKENIDGLFEFTSTQKTYWGKRISLWKRSISNVMTLTLLESAAELDKKDCLDHCTFVLAKYNCNAGMKLQACRPLATEQHYIKAMLDAKVFPLMFRCLLPLMHQALILNSTVIDSELYVIVDHIADLMTDTSLPTKQWGSSDEMVLRSRKPFLTIRHMIRPAESGFFDNLAELMVQLDRRSGRDGLLQAIVRSDRPWLSAKAYYNRLIMQPCNRFLDKMHTAGCDNLLRQNH